MNPTKHLAICAEIQQKHQLRESELLNRIAKLEAQRKPLTDEEIESMWPLRLTDSVIQFARAIEQAHGIKELA